MSRSALVLVTSSIIAVLLSACSSGSVKARRDQRDKLVQTAKLYCEFVNGENHPTDLDVALNLAMAQKCDIEKPHSLSSYRTPSEVHGMVYCCALADKKDNKDNKAMARSETPAPQVQAPAKGSVGAPPAAGSPASSGQPAAKPTPGTPAKTGSDSPYPTIPDLDP